MCLFLHTKESIDYVLIQNIVSDFFDQRYTFIVHLGFHFESTELLLSEKKIIKIKLEIDIKHNHDSRLIYVMEKADG